MPFHHDCTDVELFEPGVREDFVFATLYIYFKEYPNALPPRMGEDIDDINSERIGGFIVGQRGHNTRFVNRCRWFLRLQPCHRTRRAAGYRQAQGYALLVRHGGVRLNTNNSPVWSFMQEIEQ
jgi:hypothetical protein